MDTPFTPPSGQVVDYILVISAGQDLASQHEAIDKADKIFEENRSGKNAGAYLQCKAMLDYVREGDTVRIKSPDRFARSAVDLLTTAQTLQEEVVALGLTDLPALNTNSRLSRYMLTMLAAVAELEWSMILERQAESITIAKEKSTFQCVSRVTEKEIKSARDRIAEAAPKVAVA